jgi:aspartate aminotransferase-like enzyme
MLAKRAGRTPVFANPGEAVSGSEKALNIPPAPGLSITPEDGHRMVFLFKRSSYLAFHAYTSSLLERGKLPFPANRNNDR